MSEEITKLSYVVTKRQSGLSVEEVKQRLSHHREKAEETIRLLSMNHALLVRTTEDDTLTGNDKGGNVS